MNKIIFTLFVSFFVLSVYAQQTPTDTELKDGGKGFYRGDAILTGAVGFSQSKLGGYKKVTLEFLPKAAYFVSGHFAMGIAAGCSLMILDDNDDIGSDITNLKISLGPVVRYYHTPAKKFSFFGEVGFLYNTTTTNGGGVDEVDFNTNGFEVGLSPGVSYFISKNFALEASLGLFKTQTVKTDEDDVPSKYVHTSSFDLTDLTIGLVYKL
jgi:hypothetical protein